MSILGLIVEYNPFHAGHLHHITEAKRIVRPDAVIAVMSGNFTQRGEPAITDKWTRASMALTHGVDLVVELPVAWAVRSAAYFATGATRLLAALGATDLCFGSEYGSLEPLEKTAEVLMAESMQFKRVLHEALSQGASFAAAQDQALRAAAPGLPDAIFSFPNNTLAIHYLLAIREYGLALRAHTIRRTSPYDSVDSSVSMPSARAIRALLLQNSKAPGLTAESTRLLRKASSLGRAPISWHNFELAVVHRLRQLSAEEMDSFPESGGGLGMRLLHCARQTNDLNELIGMAKTRRFTLTRLQRLLSYILLDLRQADLAGIQDYQQPPYARVLALNTKNPAVRQVLCKTALPVVFAANRAELAEERAKHCLQIDISATDCYTLAFSKDSRSGMDFTTPVVTEKAANEHPGAWA